MRHVPRVADGAARRDSAAIEGGRMAKPSKPVFRPKQLDEAERMRCLEALVASIVHEVRQPLAALVGSAEACVRKLSPATLDLAGARDAALNAMLAADRAAATVQRMWSLFVKTQGSESVDLN